VQWWATVRAIAKAGESSIGQIVECGPGKVLTALNRRIEKRPGLEFIALEDPASVDAALAATQSAGQGVVNA
jgi:[acyl-carrier-protein] S-malonyltransferase